MLATAQSLGVKVVRHWEGDEFDFGGTRRSRLVSAARLARTGQATEQRFHGVARELWPDVGAAGRRCRKARGTHVAARHHPHASLLKVGHHGSANATTAELVDSASPAFAMISVGSGNSFGLPRMETLARLCAAGTRVYRTDLDGAVTFYLDGQSVTPSVAALQ